jgi:Fic family protein
MALTEASRALGLVDGVSRTLPNPRLLARPFARREAVLSSRIEGTQATLSQLSLFEAGVSGSETGDVREVKNYLDALDYGLAQDRPLPLSLRLIRKLHAILMDGVQRSDPTPGEFRRSQNFIGDRGHPERARYVPPPVPEMRSCLDKLERYLHARTKIPALIRIAMIHYQFEAIHPFHDGNGRVGRLLVSLLLCEEKLLSEPLLYLSAFFERDRPRYYRALLAVSTRGDWAPWLRCFLEAAVVESNATIERIHRVTQLRREYQERLQHERQSVLTLRVVEELFGVPVTSASIIKRQLGITHRGAQKIIERLTRLGILKLGEHQGRGRVHLAPEIIRTFDR